MVRGAGAGRAVGPAGCRSRCSSPRRWYRSGCWPPEPGYACRYRWSPVLSWRSRSRARTSRRRGRAGDRSARCAMPCPPADRAPPGAGNARPPAARRLLRDAGRRLGGRPYALLGRPGCRARRRGRPLRRGRAADRRPGRPPWRGSDGPGPVDSRQLAPAGPAAQPGAPRRRPAARRPGRRARPGPGAAGRAGTSHRRVRATAAGRPAAPYARRAEPAAAHRRLAAERRRRAVARHRRRHAAAAGHARRVHRRQLVSDSHLPAAGRRGVDGPATRTEPGPPRRHGDRCGARRTMAPVARRPAGDLSVQCGRRAGVRFARAALAVLLPLVLLALARRVRRARHRMAGARGAWSEVLDLLVLLGRPAPGWLPAPEVAAELAAAVPAPGEPVHPALRIARAADRAAFAPEPPEPPEPAPGEAWAALRRLRRAVRAAVPWRRRRPPR